MSERVFQIGDRVKCNVPGSWVHERVGTIEALNVVTSDEIQGHRVRIDDASGFTVVPEAELQRV